MRSNAQRPSQGFTLIEIVLVLTLIALMVGGAVGFMIASDDERVLNRSAVEVEVLAKRARSLSALQQRPYALEFHEQTVRLMPLAEALIDPRDRESAIAHQEEMAAESMALTSGSTPVRASWTMDEDVQMSIRRWASDVWLPVNEKSRHVWRFDPEGFCEPVGVRFQVENSWVEVVFNPLTASVRDRAQEIY